ncbi:MAG TPA: MFS transporter [Thermoanaerobaculia bacterium]|nr:MFS transporter [Thermoanaerobaculia bacterium]
MFRAIATAYRDAFSGLSRTVWLLSVASLVNRSGTMVMPFLTLYLVSKRGFTTTQAGEVLALYGVAAMAASYTGGWLCDRVSPVLVMKVSLALTGLSFLALGQLRSRLAIAAMVFVLSLVGEAFRPANLAALAAATGPVDRTRGFALLRLAVNMGMTLGPSVGGFLALHDYGWLFVADGVTCLLATGLLWLVPSGAEDAKAPRDRQSRAGSSPWRDGPFLAMMALMFLLATVVFQIVSTFPLTLRDLYSFSEARIGLILAVNTLIIVLFEMVLIHKLSGRGDTLERVGLGAFLVCAGLALLPLGSSFLFAAFTVMVWTMGEMLAFPIASAVVADRAEEGSLGRYMGVFNLTFATSYVAAPLIGTRVYQTWGPRVLWYGCGVVGALIWLGFHFLAVARRRTIITPALH